MMRRPLPARAVYAAKWLVAQALHRTGLLGLIAGARLRGRVVVLMYHRVLDPAAETTAWSHPGIVVRRATFERQIASLAARFRMLSLDEFETFFDRGGAAAGDDRPACLVTFDDGWIDTYRDAWPVLAASQVPAVVFLPSQFIGADRMFWRETLGRLLFDAWTHGRTDAAFARRAAAALAPHGLSGLLAQPPAAIREAILIATQALRHQGETEAPPVVAEVGALCAGVPRSETSDAFMSWDHAREMAAAGIAFGGHGVTHRILSTLPPDVVAREAAESRAALDGAFGRPAASFSYPNGGWNASVARTVADAGFRLAFSTDAGPVVPGADRLAIRRFNVHEDSSRSWPMFLARLSGVL
jgi:peptidoglycan/xylan/chitin deacetylase (PgdA/CDA1 family)